MADENPGMVTETRYEVYGDPWKGRYAVVRIDRTVVAEFDNDDDALAYLKAAQSGRKPEETS